MSELRKDRADRKGEGKEVERLFKERQHDYSTTKQTEERKRPRVEKKENNNRSSLLGQAESEQDLHDSIFKS